MIGAMGKGAARPYVAVFCGARQGRSAAHADDARAIGRAIADAGAGLIYGGGRVGLMGVLADAALGAGAPVHGVIPAALKEREVAHPGLTRLDVVDSMHERKARIAGIAAGFLALPGGLGTLDELFEIVTWKQLGHHARPVVLWNGSGYFDSLLLALRGMTEEGFIPEPALYAVAVSPREAVDLALGRVGARAGSNA